MEERVNPNMVILGRKYRGMTQNELASRLVITQKSISRIEMGLTDVGTGLLKKMAEVLRFPERFFFERMHIYPPFSVHWCD